MRFSYVLAGAAAVAALACGSTPSGPSGSQGAFNVRITDSPYGSAQAVLITFSAVEVQESGGDWKKLALAGGTSTRTCDLKKLQNSAQDVLATGGLDPATYTGVRVTVQSAKIYFDKASTSSTPCAGSIAEPAGASFPFTLSPATGQTNGTFNVTKGGTTTVLVDFDGEASVRQTTGTTYTLTPTLRLVSVQ
jgi:hypothetical protein